MGRSMRVTFAAAIALAAIELGAQAPPNRYSVGAHASYLRFRSATGLEDTPGAGVDATYRFGFSPLGADFGIGFSFVASRPLTRGDQFPLVAFDFGDTTQLLEVNQRITLLHYGLQAVLGVPISRLRVYALGGTGAYTVQLDSRQNLGNESFTRPMLQFGGGVGFAVTRDLGFRIEARDIMLLDYDRDRLDPTIPYARDRRIRDAVAAPDPTWPKPQNLQLSVVFNYVPSRTATPEEVQ